MGILQRVNGPADLKKLSLEELQQLAAEIRELIIRVVSSNGGHLAPNLGTVELTLALHRVFDSPRDRIIWDVGHQAYPHKIITGRRDRFHTLKQYGGISGFLRREESPHDIFGAGHAGTALSAAYGIAVARDLKGERFKVIAVVGDGGLTAGMALEALNNIGAENRDILVVLNDNKWSIAENVGAISQYLNRILTNPYYNRLRDDLWELLGKLPGNLDARARDLASRIEQALKSFYVPTLLFEALGLRYIGPVNGHDLRELLSTFEGVKRLKGPILVHVLTEKGHGYPVALRDPEMYHGLGPFDPATGKPKKKPGPPSYTSVFGKTLVRLAEQDERIVAITAAMPLGTGLSEFRKRFPDRFFDVGIAEQHAVTFAGGLAVEGMRPFAAIYSTFLQRAFDQAIHDIGIQNLPVRFALDRGGLVGEDGPTHHGVFDIAYLRMIPNFVVMAPKDEDELQDMVLTAALYDEGPIAFRYPRGAGEGVPMKPEPQPIPIGKAELLQDGEDLVFLAYGAAVHPSWRAARKLQEELGITCAVVNARFAKPLDREMILRFLDRGIRRLVTVEDGVLAGGFGSAVLELLADEGARDVQVIRVGVPDRFIEHGPRKLLLQLVGVEESELVRRIRSKLDQETFAYR